MSLPDHLPLPGSGGSEINLAETVSVVANMAPAERLTDAAISTAAYLLREAWSTDGSYLEEADAATAQVRAYIWQAMGGQPTRDPVHVAAAILFEATYYNVGPPEIGFLARSRVLSLGNRVTPGAQHVLAMQYDADSLRCSPAVFSVGVPSAPGLVVGLVADPDRATGTVFGIGIEDTAVTIALTDATNSWLEGDGTLAPDSATLSLARGDTEIYRYFTRSFRQTYLQLDHLTRLRREEGDDITEKKKGFLAIGLRRQAEVVKPLIQAAEKLGLSPAELGITEKWWDRYKRLVQKYAPHDER